jgi:predicted transcriptional regulator
MNPITSQLADNKTRLEKLIVCESMTIKEALKQLGIGSEKILFVVDDKGKLTGTLTDGDIRRWILSEGSLAERVSKVCYKKPKTLSGNYDLDEVRKIMIKEKVEVIPVLDGLNHVVNALFWSDIFSKDQEYVKRELKVPVLIMAGGKGTRLDPFTKIFPKPLIPFGEKPIIELILDRLQRSGVTNFIFQ